METFLLNFQICYNQFFLLENPTHWGLDIAVCAVFVKLILDIFAVCSLLPRMNFPHMQQSYLCQKNQNYLLKKADLRANDYKDQPICHIDHLRLSSF